MGYATTRAQHLVLHSVPAIRGCLRVRNPILTMFFYALLLLLDGTGLLRMGLLCALLHEMGHVLAFWGMLRRFPVLEVSVFGICLSMREVCLAPQKECVLALAGPAMNLLLCIGTLLGMRWAWGYSYVGCWFAATNLLVGGFNLLPLPGLDGTQAVQSFGRWAQYKLHFEGG